MRKKIIVPMVPNDGTTYGEEVRAHAERGSAETREGMLANALRDDNLHRPHRLLLLFIVFAMRDGFEACPSAEWLSKATGYAVPTVKNHLGELVKWGHLKTELRKPVEGNYRVAHYAPTARSLEELRAEIQRHLDAMMLRPDATHWAGNENMGHAIVVPRFAAPENLGHCGGIPKSAETGNLGHRRGIPKSEITPPAVTQISDAYKDRAPTRPRAPTLGTHRAVSGDGEIADDGAYIHEGPPATTDDLGCSWPLTKNTKPIEEDTEGLCAANSNTRSLASTHGRAGAVAVPMSNRLPLDDEASVSADQVERLAKKFGVEASDPRRPAKLQLIRVTAEKYIAQWLAMPANPVTGRRQRERGGKHQDVRYATMSDWFVHEWRNGVQADLAKLDAGVIVAEAAGRGNVDKHFTFVGKTAVLFRDLWAAVDENAPHLAIEDAKFAFGEASAGQLQYRPTNSSISVKCETVADVRVALREMAKSKIANKAWEGRVLATEDMSAWQSLYPALAGPALNSKIVERARVFERYTTHGRSFGFSDFPYASPIEMARFGIESRTWLEPYGARLGLPGSDWTVLLFGGPEILAAREAMTAEQVLRALHVAERVGFPMTHDSNSLSRFARQATDAAEGYEDKSLGVQSGEAFADFVNRQRQSSRR